MYMIQDKVNYSSIYIEQTYIEPINKFFKDNSELLSNMFKDKKLNNKQYEYLLLFLNQNLTQINKIILDNFNNIKIQEKNDNQEKYDDYEDLSQKINKSIDKKNELNKISRFLFIN